MLLKFLIVVMLLALLASLGSGFYFLMRDQGDPLKRRLFHSLGVRVTIAAGLMLLIVYGVSSGKLRSQAPWENRPAGAAAPAAPAPAPPAPERSQPRQ
jgi:hypothetical protein